MSLVEGAQRRGKTGRKLPAVLAALVVSAVVALGIMPIAAESAAADVPSVEITVPFDAPLCANTSGNPSVDADGGPVTNLRSVFGQRLDDYNDGQPVVLYNNRGSSGWTSSNSQYASNPLCVVRYVDGVGPVSSWSYCTYDRASTCGWTNAQGQLERNGVVLPGLEEVLPDNRLTADQQKLQAYIIQNDVPVMAGSNGNGGTVGADTVANDDTSGQRSLRQTLVHCIDNPGRSSGLVFCANNMSPATQTRILEIIGGDPAAMLTATSPSASVLPGANGEIEVTTTLAGIPLELDVTGGTVTVCDGDATLTGSTLVVDVDATLPATITLCATRPDAGSVSVSLSGQPPVIQNAGFYQSGTGTLCQIFAANFAENQQSVIASGSVVFADAPVPVIGTTLVDQADGDKNIVQSGGTVVDTVAYENLEPNREYTVTGELHNKADGNATGITGSSVFTSSDTGTGTVDVEFIIDDEWAGATLVAFEILTLGNTEIATHQDIEDAAQTVYVADLGTTLVDEADGDKNVAAAGGTVVDTVAYTNLKPNTSYTITGELFDKADGSATGITGTVTFTSTDTGSGTADVEFVIDSEWAGATLVAFETVSEGDVVIAVHEDINDSAQTVIVGNAPRIGTTLADELDGDKYIVQSGGTVIDTVAYENLEPNTEYTVSGELHDKADGSATGITGSSVFTSSATGTGTVEVEFTITDEWAGHTLTAFEVVAQGATEIATHEDINDTAQTVFVADLGTTLVDQSDGDKNVAAAGGTVVDTVAYTNLKPNTSYTITGELFDKADGGATGITGTVTFTSSATGNGSALVEFVIDADWAGATLVAFETVSEGDAVIAVHEDINDGAQTVTVGTTPRIGTTLTDELDGDKFIVQSGGTVIDTIAYENLQPNTSYVVSGELFVKADGSETGITGTTSFTSSATGAGSVEVEFVVDGSWAGEALVAFEVVTQGGVEIATHEDINDAAQTVYVADLATTLVDKADGDKNIAATGGNVVDTVAYTNLKPNTAYTVSGELYDKATGKATGLTGSESFTTGASGNGTVEVGFLIGANWAGHTLVAFEVVVSGGLEIATHEDINDAAQTVTVSNPKLASTGLGGESVWFAAAGFGALMSGAVLLLIRRRRNA